MLSITTNLATINYTTIKSCIFIQIFLLLFNLHIVSPYKLWPDGIIPYKFDKHLRSNINFKLGVINAIMDVNSRTCIKFVDKYPNSTAYIEFNYYNTQKICWNFAGYKSGKTSVNAGAFCVTPLKKPYKAHTVFTDCDIIMLNKLYNCPTMLYRYLKCNNHKHLVNFSSLRTPLNVTSLSSFLSLSSRRYTTLPPVTKQSKPPNIYTRNPTYRRTAPTTTSTTTTTTRITTTTTPEPETTTTMLQLFSPFPPIFLPFPVPTTTAEIPKTTIESTTTTTASLPETTTTLLTTIPSTTTTRKLTSTTQKSTTTTEQNNIIEGEIEGELFGPTPKTIKPIGKWTKKDKIISSHLTCSSTCEYEGDLRPLFRLYNGILGINDNMLESDPIMLKQLQMNNYVIKHSKTYIAEVEDTELCQCAVPLYRLYNELNHDHFYTTNNTEADSARDRAGYVFQNIEGYCTQYAGCGAFLPLYRFYNPFLRDHLYTTDQAEMLFFKTNLIQGYVFEKIECYLWAFEVPTKNCQHLL